MYSNIELFCKGELVSEEQLLYDIHALLDITYISAGVRSYPICTGLAVYIDTLYKLAHEKNYRNLISLLDNRGVVEGTTELMLAAMIGHTYMVAKFVENGAPHSKVNIFGYDALFFAVVHANLITVRELLTIEGLCLVNQNNDGVTALMCAIAQGHQKIVEEILTRARSRSMDELSELINIKDHFGWAALLIASKNNQLEILKNLIEAAPAINLDSKNLEGATALIIAIENNNKEIATLLIQAGADLNLQNSKGLNALMIALMNNHLPTISLLYDSGASLDLSGLSVEQKNKISSGLDFLNRLIASSQIISVTAESKDDDAHDDFEISLVEPRGKRYGKEALTAILSQPSGGERSQFESLYIDDLNYSELTADNISSLLERRHVFAKDLFFGIHAKYSQISAAAPIPLVLKKKGHSKIIASQQEVAYYLQIAFRKIESFELLDGTVLKMRRSHREYTLYSVGAFNTRLPAIVVFAGRKEQALLPPSDSACVFIIFTQEEFDSLAGSRENLHKHGYHIVVLNAPLGVDRDCNLTVLGDKKNEAGRLTARRRVALCLCYDYDFESLMMMDDNIETLSCSGDDQEIAPENLWGQLLESLLFYHNEAPGIISTVQTQNPNIEDVDTAQNRIGWKLILFKLSSIRRLFTRDQIYFLLPTSLTASSEDAFMQLVAHVAAQRDTQVHQGYSRLSQKTAFLTRAKTNRHVCARSGVVAQHIQLDAYEEQAAKNYLGEHKFESLQIAIMLFNNTLDLNLQIRQKSNKARVEYDIAGAIAKKRQSETAASGTLFKISEDIDSFEAALYEVASSENLALREPQSECLKKIAAVAQDSSKINISILPTGTGKTRIQAYLAYGMLHTAKDKHIAIIAPTRILTQQIDNDFYKEWGNIAKEYQQLLVPVYSSSKDPATSLSFLLQNTHMQQKRQGHIFVFCARSFSEMLAVSLDKDHTYYQDSNLFLGRLKMCIFDEEHLTFSETVAEQLTKLQQVGALRSLSHLFGFTATSPVDPLYASFRIPNTYEIKREIIFNYASKDAVAAGFIRPICYSAAEADDISTFLNNCQFTDGSPLLSHVGIIVCSSISQISSLRPVVAEINPRLKVYDIHSKKKDLMAQLSDFSMQTEYAVALVVDMLKEGYNHPEVRYTISLKNMSPATQEQRVGRCRRKVSPGDTHTALFIKLDLGSREDGSVLGKASRAGRVETDEATDLLSPCIFKASTQSPLLLSRATAGSDDHRDKKQIAS